MAPRAKSLPDRFWPKVDRRGPDECWPWTASSRRRGYGQINRAGAGSAKEPAHRVSYELSVGPIPAGMFVCHRCDNPPCCNPAHLFLGTAKDNQADMDAKGRRRSATGEAHGMAKLTDAQAEEIRRRYAAGGVFQRELAREYGVTPSNISHIVTFATRKAA